MNHLDLCSGIGGFALAASWTWPGHRPTFVEIDPFCQAVLRKHWPDATIHGDIHSFSGKSYAGTTGILTAGFPCQPYSVAGKRGGDTDDRAIWPQVFRVITEARPRWVVLENVTGIITMALDGVLSDMEAEGYTCGTVVIPACAVNAPHRRDRVWVVAYVDSCDAGQFIERHGERTGANRAEERARLQPQPCRCGEALADSNGRGQQERPQLDSEPEQDPTDGNPCGGYTDRRGNAHDSSALADTDISNGEAQRSDRMGEGRAPAPPTRSREDVGNANGQRCEERNAATVTGRPQFSGWESARIINGRRLPQSDICLLAHGVSGRVARLKALGNAISPQVAAEVFRAIDALK